MRCNEVVTLLLGIQFFCYYVYHVFVTFFSHTYNLLVGFAFHVRAWITGGRGGGVIQCQNVFDGAKQFFLKVDLHRSHNYNSSLPPPSPHKVMIKHSWNGAQRLCCSLPTLAHYHLFLSLSLLLTLPSSQASRCRRRVAVCTSFSWLCYYVDDHCK